jgi:hypothetical protein
MLPSSKNICFRPLDKILSDRSFFIELPANSQSGFCPPFETAARLGAKPASFAGPAQKILWHDIILPCGNMMSEILKA